MRISIFAQRKRIRGDFVDIYFRYLSTRFYPRLLVRQSQTYGNCPRINRRYLAPTWHQSLKASPGYAIAYLPVAGASACTLLHTLATVAGCDV